MYHICYADSLHTSAENITIIVIITKKIHIVCERILNYLIFVGVLSSLQSMVVNDSCEATTIYLYGVQSIIIKLIHKSSENNLACFGNRGMRKRRKSGLRINAKRLENGLKFADFVGLRILLFCGF